MRFTIILAALFVFLAACAPAAPQPIIVPSAPAPVEQPPVAPPVEPPAVEQSPAESEPTPAEEGVYERPVEEGPSIPKYLNQFKNEVTSYSFVFKSDNYLVAGKHARIDLFRVLQNQYHAPFIDTVYLDLERKTAIGVCEGRNDNIKKQCAVQDALGRKYALPYVQFKITLPEDWLVESQNLYVTESATPTLVTDRPTVHLKHSTKTRTIDFFIDPAIGLPIIVIEDNLEYQYTKLAKNQLGFQEKIVP